MSQRLVQNALLTFAILSVPCGASSVLKLNDLHEIHGQWDYVAQQCSDGSEYQGYHANLANEVWIIDAESGTFALTQFEGVIDENGKRQECTLPSTGKPKAQIANNELSFTVDSTFDIPEETCPQEVNVIKKNLIVLDHVDWIRQHNRLQSLTTRVRMHLQVIHGIHYLVEDTDVECSSAPEKRGHLQLLFVPEGLS